VHLRVQGHGLGHFGATWHPSSPAVVPLARPATGGKTSIGMATSTAPTHPGSGTPAQGHMFRRLRRCSSVVARVYATTATSSMCAATCASAYST
jgi:hypothetical protein